MCVSDSTKFYLTGLRVFTFAWFDLAIADIPLKCIDFVGINARLDEPLDRTLYENLTYHPDLPFCWPLLMIFFLFFFFFIFLQILDQLL